MASPHQVPNMLKTNQTVSDAQLVDAVHYAIRLTEFRITLPSIQLVKPNKQHRMLEEGCLVLDAAERRGGLQRMLEPNTLGRLRALLEMMQVQLQSRGVAV